LRRHRWRQREEKNKNNNHYIEDFSEGTVGGNARKKKSLYRGLLRRHRWRQRDT
jgi:hypothetical protein